MDTPILIKERLLFQEEVRLTRIIEYGYGWQELTEEKTPVPPGGARFDIHFEGHIAGDRLNGTIKGIDYLEVRADGHFILNLQACITTGDGARIKVSETGTNDQGKLGLSMTFHTSDKRYAWVNPLHIWGTGEVDFRTGIAAIEGYLI